MQNCRVREGFKIKVIKPSKTSEVARTIINVRKFIRKALNTPNRYQVYNLSNHKFGEKELKANIAIEKLFYDKKQVINVKTNVETVFLKPI